jgi:hypothetical protein
MTKYTYLKKHQCQVLWCMPVIPVLGRQKDHELRGQARLHNETLYLKQKEERKE